MGISKSQGKHVQLKKTKMLYSKNGRMSVKKILLAANLSLLASYPLMGQQQGSVTISCDYPGGNIKVIKLASGRVEIAPDLRDTQQKWFYWNFSAKAETPGTVKFLFPVNEMQMSAQGPAVSTDGGKNWRWLGKQNSAFLVQEPEGKRDSFTWNFKEKGEQVRFAQGIPYQRSALDAFLEKHRNNPSLKISVLTKTRKGKDVPLLVIGNTENAKNILLTARHHACEAIANYVMEGFLEEALSNSTHGRTFREKFTLYAVPFVDLDGVEAGDQGKGRAPHDHNRDYGLSTNLYPEIKAITDLSQAKKFFIGIDLHAPSVRGDIHETFYFDGFRSPENNANTVEFGKWVYEESPAMVGRTLNLLKPKARKATTSVGTSFSHYSPFSPDMVYAVTLECPYATRNPDYDAISAKEYGKGLLRAMQHMEFRKGNNKHTGYDDFQKFSRSLNGAPANFIQKAEAVLNDPNASPLYKAEANLRLGWLYPRMRKFDLAVKCNEAVLHSEWATARQKTVAAIQKTETVCKNPATTDEVLAKWTAELDGMRLSGISGYNVNEIFYNRSMQKKDLEKAYSYALKQLGYAPEYEIGRIRNRIASYYSAKGEKDKAAEYSRETAAFLRKQLIPKMPVGIFGPRQAEELVNALMMIPNTPKQEIIDAASLALNHKVCTKDIKKRLDAILSGLNQKKEQP